MKKRSDACVAIFERIKAHKSTMGIKTFRKTPTDQAKIEELPICFMLYGSDNIIKRSSRSVATYNGVNGNMRSLEVIFELVANKQDDVLAIFEKLRAAIFVDVHPLKKLDGSIDPTTFIMEERTEGPVGYGLPDIEAMNFIINLVYLDE